MLLATGLTGCTDLGETLYDQAYGLVGDELGIAQPVKDVDIDEIGDARLVEQGLQPNDMPVFEPWAAQRKVMSEALR